MRRFLILIGLSSALALGCSSSSGGGGAGAGGSAGAGGVGGAAGGAGAGGVGGAGDACLDDLDILLEIGDVPAFIGDTCVLGEYGCALMEVAPCVAECLEMETGLPQDCGLCAGLVTDCVLVDCIPSCTADPDDPTCVECIEAQGEACNPLFEACAGFAVP